MDYTTACSTLGFESQNNICNSITQVLLKYHEGKQKNHNKKLLRTARDLILLPLVSKQTETGKIKINPPFPDITCKDCNGTGKKWSFEKINLSFVCKECENKGLNYKCKTCNNTGIVKKEKSTGKIKTIFVCTTCKGEGTIETKIFNPVISFDSRMKLRFNSMI